MVSVKKKNMDKTAGHSNSTGTAGTTVNRKNISGNWDQFLAQLPKQQDHTQNSHNNKKEKKPWTKNKYKPKPSAQTDNGVVAHETGITSESAVVRKNSWDKNQNDNTPVMETCDINSKDNTNNEPPIKKGPTITKYVGIDCEMVGIGPSGRESILARASLVNSFGDCIYDKFVKPREKVTDYRTPVSGVRESDLVNGEKFEVVQKEIADILKGRFLVGHALKHDMEVLFLSHPKSKIRDTSKYKPFRALSNGKTPSLQLLAKSVLSTDIQKSEHNSVEDARVAMQLYQTHSKTWEAKLHARNRDRRLVHQRVQAHPTNTSSLL